MYLSDADVRKCLDLSFQLGGCRDTTELERAASLWLFEEIPSEACAFHEFTRNPPMVRIRIHPDIAVEEDLERLAREQMYGGRPDHPLWIHYFVRLAPLTPLRLSDLIDDRRLLRTATYNDVLRLYSIRRQMAIVYSRSSPGTGGAYVSMRSICGFTDADLALATAVQPVLTALHQALACTAPVVRHDDDGNREGPPIRLTSAEASVLELLARGLTATAISHLRRTSVRTSRKHLENIYAKLGAHDRLQAVTEATRLGVLVSRSTISDGEHSDSTRVQR